MQHYTGIAATLIEYVLGVDEKQILEDYELTNKYRERYNKEIVELLVRKYGVSPERAATYGLAKGKFLKVFFDALARNYGSLDLSVQKMVLVWIRKNCQTEENVLGLVSYRN